MHTCRASCVSLDRPSTRGHRASRSELAEQVGRGQLLGQPVKHVRNRPRSRRFLPGWLSLLFIVGLLLPSSAMAATANSASPSQSTYFSQTGYWVSDPFLTFWRQHGGLTAFGYPISRVFYQ